jgi:transcriptional regulator with XRE-family HTH domain
MNLESEMSSSRIKTERQKRSWTQEQLAERARLSTRTVQRIECGAEASAETLRLIAEALGIPAESLREAPQREHFRAPWGRVVKAVTFTTIAVAFGLSLLPYAFPLNSATKSAHLILMGALLISLLMSVSGYTVRPGQLLVHRIGWATRFDLSKLTGCEVNPHAMMGSIRLFGNGGLFCYIGFFRNAVLGNFRAFATDPTRSVVLTLGGRTVVVTPDDPDAFALAVQDAAKDESIKPTALASP